MSNTIELKIKVDELLKETKPIQQKANHRNR